MKVKKQIPVYDERESFIDHKMDHFYVSSYQDKNDKSLNRIDEHKHTYYEIIWVEEGRGNHEIDFTKYRFNGPCLFLLHPQNVHKIYKECPSKGGVIKFNDQFFSTDETNINFLLKFGVFDDIDVFPVLNLNKNEADEIKNYFSIIYAEYKKTSVFSPTILLSVLKAFLLKIYEFKKKNTASKGLKNNDFIRFKQFQKLVEKNFLQMHQVSFYANLMNLSEKTLYNTCKAISEKSAQELIQQRILLEAKRLLVYSNFSVKEIATQLGFDDYSYFTRFFSKNVGFSPIQFRQQHL
ncbi:MAG TPA: helix-turn-helix transcriptional regulator [Chitinophagaceae bacterium]